VSLTTRVLLALIAGITLGLVLSAVGGDAARIGVQLAEPVGTLFVNAIRMTVIPLVVSSLIVGIATSSSAAMIGRIGGRGFGLFVVLLAASGVVGALVAPPVLAHVSLDAATAARMRDAAGAAGASSPSAIQGPAQWIEALVPANAVQALTDGSMLPLIVFAVILGLALMAIPPAGRERVVTIFRAFAAAMLVLVSWLLVVAPIGVFALALPLVARLGIAAVGALATYVVLVSLAAAVFMVVVLYPAAVLGGGVSIAAFARAAAPAQAVAASSRSSLAALPALIESGTRRLNLPAEITGFFLPLASAMFRVGATLGLTTGAVFIARLYGITVTTTQLVTIVATATVTSFSIPGIPGGSIIAMAPVLASVGLPIEGLGILLGVDTIPDIFRTTANVTGQLAAATIIARHSREPQAVTLEPVPEPE
jgi:Na+/H+-dicarboxylate symporter